MTSKNIQRVVWAMAGIAGLIVVLSFLLPENVYAPLQGVFEGAVEGAAFSYWNWSLLTVGDLKITPAVVMTVLVFVVALVLLSGFVTRVLHKRLLAHFPMDEGVRYALARVSGYVVFVVGGIVGIQALGVNLSSLVVLGGAVGIGIGLGLQSIAQNFVSGLTLLLERPIKVGDRVEVGGLSGDVVHIAGRSTWVRTNDNVVIIIPNSEFINRRVINWTANDRQVRFGVPVGVSYSSSPEKVREILLGVARQNPDVLAEPKPDVLFRGFGDSSLDFELRVWTVSKVQYPHILRSDLYFSIFQAFDENGIEIPFPQRDLHLRSVSPDAVKDLRSPPSAALPEHRTEAAGEAAG